jgi:cytochrome b561
MPATPSESARYTLPAIALHWLLALLILGVFSAGLYMADLPSSPERSQLFDWHKWFGLLILALSLLRLAWRATHQPPPALPAPGWQTVLAQRTHQLMYLLFFAVPLLGWAHSSAAGASIVWFGLVQMPALLGPDKALAEITESLHALLADGLIALVGLHVAAALKHHWIDGDGLLRRMLPGRD